MTRNAEIRTVYDTLKKGMTDPGFFDRVRDSSPAQPKPPGESPHRPRAPVTCDWIPVMTDWHTTACGPVSPWSENLNDAQRAAVEHTSGPLLVIAGAGSGKTRTLTHRVARLVDGGAPPAAILLLTFTRKAAQEMLRRATCLLDQRCERVAGGTFHSFANLKLRQYGDRARTLARTSPSSTAPTPRT